MSDPALEYLMSAGVPSAKFPDIGTKVEGRILRYELTQQKDLDGNLKTFDSGEPMMQIVFTLDTGVIDPDIEGDDGTRKVYAKAQMLQAVREAVKKTGHRGRLTGGILGVKYVRDGEATKRGFNAPKIYAAKFEAPTETDELDIPVEPEYDESSLEPF